MLLTATANQIEIESIVAKSRTLAERLSLSCNSNTHIADIQRSWLDRVAKDPSYQIEIEKRLRHWCQTVAKGNFAKFKKRLIWAGLSIETVYSLLASDLNEVRSLPDWANTLQQAIEQARISTEKFTFSYLDPANPIPFEQVYFPFLQIAKERLSDKIGDRLHLLSNSAFIALQRQLLQELNSFGFATLMSEFSTFKPRKNILPIVLYNNKYNTSSIKYDAFIKQLFVDGLQSLFLKYSVLGRLIATKVDLWVDKTAEFIDRLAANWSEIERNFSPKQSLSEVTNIETSLSEPHNEGREAIILTFNTGMKLVYKPENLGIEVAFYQLLNWLNSQNALLPFKILQVINHGTYGWIEYVEQKSCVSSKEITTFYQRAGMLLCLVYLLKGKDCNSEKIVANGEHPILIDSKTLLHHRIKNYSCDTVDSEAAEKLNDSVLQAQMIPVWGVHPKDSLAIDLSALGGTEEQKFTISKVQKINTDQMYIDRESRVVKQANIPQLRNEPLNARNYLSEITLGFEQMYDFSCSHKETLLCGDSPLQNFARQKVRYVFRATKTYQTILHDSFHPALLQSGIDRSISIDVLSRAFITETKKPAFWSILDAEIQAIEGLDIPLFEVDTEQTKIELSTGVNIPELFKESSFEAVISRLKSLSNADLNLQLEIIRGSFCAKFMKESNCITLPHSYRNSSGDGLEVSNTIHNSQSSGSIATSELVKEAVAIAQELQQRGIYDHNGVSWIGLGLRPNAPGFQLQSLSNNLYDGRCGVALFFAALSKITKNSHWQDLALKTLIPLRRILRSNSEVVQRLKLEGIGGATGLSSIVYSLVQIGQLINNSSIIEDAKKAARLITADSIDRNNSSGLIDGTAGTILACLKLYEIEPNALNSAIACGEHLLQQLDRSLPQLPTGLAEGSVGIAYALSQLFEITQDSRYLVGTEKAIALYTNRIDTNSKEAVFHNTWAGGTAGIGLGHLGMMSVLNNSAMRKEIDRSIIQTQNHCLSDVDSLAWGNFGRIETLLVASQTLNRPQLYDFALQATTTLVRQARSRGRFNLNSLSVPVVYNPGFFHGTSGIGYQLLKIAYPRLLPSILLWE